MLQGSYRINEDSNENYDLPSQKNECSYVHRPNIFLRLFFLSSYGLTAKLRGKIQRFLIYYLAPLLPKSLHNFPHYEQPTSYNQRTHIDTQDP